MPMRSMDQAGTRQPPSLTDRGHAVMITSDSLELASEELRGLSGALFTESEAIGKALSMAEGSLAAIRTSWVGPLPDDVHTSADTYLAELAVSVPAVESSAEVIASLANVALELSGQMSASERLLAFIAEARSAGQVYPGMDQEARDARDAIEDIRVLWRRTCASRADSLGPGIAALARCRDAAVSALPMPAAALYGAGYAIAVTLALRAINGLSIEQGGGVEPMTFADVDPSGLLLLGAAGFAGAARPRGGPGDGALFADMFGWLMSPEAADGRSAEDLAAELQFIVNAAPSRPTDTSTTTRPSSCG